MSAAESFPSGPIRVRVRAIGAGGVGVGDLPDGRVVFLPRTAPGDLVEVELLQEKDRWARGFPRAILEEGEGRREAPCPLYADCDGCALQHLEYPEQLRWKGRIVGDALRRIGGLDAGDPEVVPSPRELGYRNKATLTLRRLPGGRIVAGFHQLRNRSRILDLTQDCLLLKEALARMWASLRSGWGAEARRLPSGRELRLTIRFGEDLGALVIRGGRGDGDPGSLVREVEGLGAVWREGREGIRHLAGDPSMELTWMEEPREVVGNAFVQVNKEGGESLHRFLLDAIGEVRGLSVVEGYCGTGVLGHRMAREGAGVVGIEADPQAVGEARREAPDTFRVVEGAVEASLEACLPADLVLLNPPRTGVATEVCEVLARSAVPRVVYVSCDPATLARDLRALGRGYRVAEVRSFDLFPQTGHVESVAFLLRRSA